MASDIQRACGLWLKEGKNGKFMSGHLENEIPPGCRLMVFKNDKKRGERDQEKKKAAGSSRGLWPACAGVWTAGTSHADTEIAYEILTGT
jgi:hypothetical protein